MENKTIKTNLHPKNNHRNSYDFKTLILANPKLKPYVFLNKYENLTIDFSDAKAVFELNSALLKSFYNIEFYEIPKGYLCPPIPGRADYIHYLADLLDVSKQEKVKILDIGTGANLIYPILGTQLYHWDFVASDIDKVSLENAKNIVENNACLKEKIEIREQKDKQSFFKNIIQEDEFFNLSICNPPFHKSQEEAQKGTMRKNRNLKNKNSKNLNFGGKSNELWCKGGEVLFIKKMIDESLLFAKQVHWFTSLVSKKENLDELIKILKSKNISEHKVIEMKQGQKISRFIAWRF